MASWTFRRPEEGPSPAPSALQAFSRASRLGTPEDEPLRVYDPVTRTLKLWEPSAPAAAPEPRPALQDASHRVNQPPARPSPMGKKQPRGYQAAMKIADDMIAEMRATGRMSGTGPPPSVQAPVAAPPAPVAPFSAFDALAAASQRLAAASNATAAATATATAGKTTPTSSGGGGGGSRKRKAETSLDDDIAAYKQDLSHINVDGMPMDLNCNQVRSRINKVLDSGIFKKGEFCDTIGSSSNAVNRFLALSGPDKGCYSDAYGNAWAWFKQRELAGLKMPDVKKRQAAEAKAKAKVAAAAGGPPAKKTKTGATTTAAAAAAAGGSEMPDLSSITLWGEDTDSVPVFDSADEIRKKINAHLKTPGLTQAQFCRDLYAQLRAPTCKAIQTKQLTDFRNKKGPLSGVSSSVFYAAYVLFEKMRLAKGKPKSAHRLAMERAHPGGLDTTRDGSRQHFWLGPGESVTVDALGLAHIHGRGR